MCAGTEAPESRAEMAEGGDMLYNVRVVLICEMY